MPEGSSDGAKPQTEDKFRLSAPQISLPKGGGAIRGIGEKFAANPVTGTGSMSVPIAVSPGRAGFGPQLSLTYDSGAGNGAFGFGWSLGLPQISRKTDKGLPQYHDAEASDVFLLSGAEDLVPVLVEQNGRWILEPPTDRTISAATYTVHRFRPRLEGLFARIERWTRTDGDVHWRSISKDNVLTLYGKDANSRIADPSDPLRVFTWLVCETRDDKGNAVVYEYKAEDGAGVDLSSAHERNRGDRDDPRRAANRYIKRIRYGNRVPLLDESGRRPLMVTAEQLRDANWMFEVVFDYGEHDPAVPTPVDAAPWLHRSDAFSSYRAGFEVRTARLCQRVLMFHHFAAEPGVGMDCLVRSTDFRFSHQVDPADSRNPVYTFLLAVTQSGYKRVTGGYHKSSLPPVEYRYTEPIVQDAVHDVDPASLENLPIGVDGAAYQWTDLHGEGIPGVLTEQAPAWFYKRNVSPITDRNVVALGPTECVATKPRPGLASGQAQFMDLAGDGQPDLVVLDGFTPGLYEHDDHEGWQPFRPFTSRLNRDMRDPNLKFVDLDGDGHADLLISEAGAFVWHPSLGEAGFGPARRVSQAIDEEKGPRLIFADSTHSIYLADLCGDGLTDLVRVSNGEVCYWPNLGYGRFGGKVTMDNAPLFDNPDQFEQERIRLADIDGSGTTDLIYLHQDGVRLYFNQSGNSWSQPQHLRVFPRVDDLVSIVPTDLLGNGTACLVWSSPLPGDARRQMRYVDLMGGQKPHLLINTINNLGAETIVHYAPSTRFYLQDKRDGTPWITRLPFPVHVVERVETYDHISRNRFVTRSAYHHGYFDGEEREFRGFGMVEQWDTEEIAALTADGTLPATNIDVVSHVPPVRTKTWFHTGAYLGADHVSDFFAGLLDPQDQGEYYREPELSDDQASALLLPDTVLPGGLTPAEEREAARSLKGAMLRQEIYALDGTARAQHPYTVTEQNFTVRRVQPREGNRHAVFFTHPREAVTFHYERNPADPRVQHATTLDVDAYGNVLRAIAVGYRRRDVAAIEPEQRDTHLTLTLNRVSNHDDEPDWRRIGLPVETRSYEVVKPPTADPRFTSEELSDLVAALVPFGQHAPATAGTIPYEQWDWRRQWDPQAEPGGPASTHLRLIEHVRTLYRRDDLTGALPPGEAESLALPFESYKLALTRELAANLFVASGKLTGAALDSVLADEGKYVHGEGDSEWWIPSGQVFYSPIATDTAPQELAYARQHFFLPHRYRNPFHSDAVSTESVVRYDDYDLLLVETRDALDNVVTAATVDDGGDIAIRIDYRVLQPYWMTDPNGNRTAVAFDALGMVVGTAVMGKPLPAPVEGDSLEGFDTDLSEEVMLAHLANPLVEPHAILGRASSRLVYDLFAYLRTKHEPAPQPAVVYTLARETHDSDLVPPGGLKIQHSFSYSDGFGREIQKKVQAEAGPAPRRDAGIIIVGADGQPEMTSSDVSPRWVGSGWTVSNNKGKPVRQYEPFFTDTHRFEFDVRIGVSPVLFYDPVERVVATLHPNHTWEKVLFDPWRQESWDVSDTALIGDPGSDADVGHFFRRLAAPDYLPSWHGLRTDQAHAAAAAQRWPDARDRAAEKRAAEKSSVHAATPTIAHADTLGRAFLTVAHNRFKYSDRPETEPPTEQFYTTRVVFDIESNQREVIDANDRIVMRYDYDLLGTRIHQASMEAGERWMLGDVAGQPIRAWDSRGHAFRTEYDPLHRPLRTFVGGIDSANPDREFLTERLVYGEQHPESVQRNLRGGAYLHLDQAGVVSSDAMDFKGNPLRGSRRLTNGTQYKETVDWRTVDANHVALPANAKSPVDLAALAADLAARLDIDTYTSSTTYDALNRPVTVTSPDDSVYRPTFNEANLLEKVDVHLRGADAVTHFVTDIDYDAKGQRRLIDYGNGVTTTYQYDPLTLRLTHLLTRRGAASFPADCPQPAPDGWPGCQVQNLHYTYDPAGNITHIRDDAQQLIYFSNKRVEPSAEYLYDAVYRLIEATGREHLGQVGGAPIPHSHDDAPRVGINWSANDGGAMGTYLEQYVYDPVGNFLFMHHRRSAQTAWDWTRSYFYDEASQLRPNEPSNRLTRTTIGNTVETYSIDGDGYDVHGSMLRMPHLPLMGWDYKDQLQATSRQVSNSGTPETTYYVYDAAGRRARNVTERQAATGETATRMKERIYVGGFEVYREYQNDGVTASLERETLHVIDDNQRVALIETRTDGLSPAPQTSLIRYQLGNHLGSVSLELDDEAELISYEEYTPYGSTSYQAVQGQTDTAKRYRYTGMERDDETGLAYHQARYYPVWLGLWVSCDPEGTLDGANLYAFCRRNPIVFCDREGTNAEAIYKQLAENFDTLTAAVATKRQLSQAMANQDFIIKQASALVEKAFTELSEMGTSGRSARSVEREIERLTKTMESNTRRAADATIEARAIAPKLIDAERTIENLNAQRAELTKQLGQSAHMASEDDLRRAKDALKPKSAGSWLRRLFGRKLLRSAIRTANSVAVRSAKPLFALDIRSKSRQPENRQAARRGADTVREITGSTTAGGVVYAVNLLAISAEDAAVKAVAEPIQRYVTTFTDSPRRTVVKHLALGPVGLVGTLTGWF